MSVIRVLTEYGIDCGARSRAEASNVKSDGCEPHEMTNPAGNSAGFCRLQIVESGSLFRSLFFDLIGPSGRDGTVLALEFLSQKNRQCEKQPPVHDSM